MRLLARAGRGAEALRVYRALAETLRAELGVAPGPEAEALRAGGEERPGRGYTATILAAGAPAAGAPGEAWSQVMAEHGGRPLPARAAPELCVAVFADVAAALAAACDAGQALLAAGNPASLALHTGRLARGDGATLERARRLCALAQPGQILVSQASEALLREAPLPAAVRLRPLGAYRVAGNDRAEGVFQALHPALPAPPPRRGSEAHAQLPLPLSSFVGREEEVADLCALLAEPAGPRLLTLAGSGGCGKTRLALEVAAGAQAGFADGARLADLTPLAGTTSGGAPLVAGTVATALGVREEPDRPLAETLAAALQPLALLLVLDNCEHLAEVCAGLAATLLRACPHLRILATSQRPLGVPGERLHRLPPLGLPSLDPLPPLEVLARTEAARLFLERARAIRPGLVPQAAEGWALARICVLLEGIPLALELAAVWAGALSLGQIAERLGGSLLALGGAGGAVPARQQTLRAALGWSCGLLSGRERLLLGRLSVFAGGWTLAAAEAVCAGEGLEAAAVAGELGGLVAKSLVQVEEGEEEPRYRLLEVVRLYAVERLEEAGEPSTRRGRHLAWCTALAEAVSTAPRSEAARRLARLETEHDNLRAALRWALATGQAAGALRLVGYLQLLWYRHAHLTEGRAATDAALALPGAEEAPPEDRARAVYTAGMLATQQGDLAAAIPHLESALALSRRFGYQSGIRSALNSLAIVVRNLGDLDRAATLHEECLALARDDGERDAVASNLNNLGVVANFRGDFAGAAAYYTQSLALLREIGDAMQVALVLANLAEVTWFAGDGPRAAALFRESLAEHERLDFRQGVVMCLEGLAWAAHVAGGLEAGVRLLGAADALRRAINFAPDPPDRAWRERGLAALRAAMDTADAGASRFERAWADGAALPVERAVAEALAVEGPGAGAPGPWYPDCGSGPGTPSGP